MNDFEKGMQVGMDIMAKFADGMIDAIMSRHRLDEEYVHPGTADVANRIQAAIKSHREDLRNIAAE